MHLLRRISIKYSKTSIFSESVRDRMKADFLALRQGSTNVVEYERIFIELSRYAMDFISTEANRAKHFEQGMRSAI